MSVTNVKSFIKNADQICANGFYAEGTKQNPESEFDIRKLPKSLICKFIDNGYKPSGGV